MNTEQQQHEIATSSSDIEVIEDGTILIVPHGLNPHTKRQLVGATIVGAFAGCLGCGPLLGIPLGAGTAALAVSSKSRAGNWARTGGEAVAQVGDRIQKLDQEHHFVEKTKEKATKGYQWTSTRIHKLDEDHHLLDKTKDTATKGYQWAHQRLEPYDSPQASVE